MRRSGRIVATIRFSDLFFSVTIEKLSLLINIYTQIFISHSGLSQIPPDSHISGILTRHTLIQRSKGRTQSPRQETSKMAKSRFLNSIIATAQSHDVAMPWTRGSARNASVSRRQTDNKSSTSRRSAVAKSA